MSAPLYTRDILRLATETSDFPRLAKLSHSVEKRAPVCGSRIVVDVATGPDGQVIAFGQDVNACALGQASATLLARSIVGRTGDDVRTAGDQLARWLSDETAMPPEWPGIDVLERARGYPARHGAIRLPFEAAAEALA